jgi:hypothetical protein
MRKKLIAAIIAVLLCVAAAVCVIMYMENKPVEQPDETTAPVTTPVETEAAGTEATTEPTEPTEETVGLTFPTEDPSDVAPEDTFGEDDVVPPVTGDSTTGETEDPDANETPEDEF